MTRSAHIILYWKTVISQHYNDEDDENEGDYDDDNGDNEQFKK